MWPILYVVLTSLSIVAATLLAPWHFDTGKYEKAIVQEKRTIAAPAVSSSVWPPLSVAATTTADCLTSRSWRAALAVNTKFQFLNCADGDTVFVKVTQPNVGGKTASFPQTKDYWVIQPREAVSTAAKSSTCYAVDFKTRFGYLVADVAIASSTLCASL